MPTSLRGAAASGRTAVAKLARAARDRWARLPARWRASALVAVAAVVAGAVCLALLRPSPEPRARRYIAFKACLLTDSRGIAGKEAAPVWQGMQRASLKTHAKIQYIAVSGPATVANARPYLASLVQRDCGVILAAGDLPTETVTASAKGFGTARFVVLGTTAARGNATTANVSATNVTAANVAGTDVPGTVARIVADAVR